MDIIINPPVVSSVLGAGQNDSHTVHQVAVVICALAIASQRSTKMAFSLTIGRVLNSQTKLVVELELGTCLVDFTEIL